jgi:ATP-binding cassette subfamily B protein
VDTIRRFVGVQLLEIVRTLAMLVVALIIMFSMHVPMALLTIVTLPVLFFSSFIYFKKVRKQFTLSDEAEGKLSSTLQENLTGVRVVRAFGQQKKEIDKFTDCNTEFKTVTHKLIKMLGLYWGLTDIIAYGQILITLLAGVYLAVTGGFTLGQFIVFTAYAGMLTWPVRQMGRILADLGKATVSLERIDEILSHPVEPEPGKALKPSIRGEIEFKNVCFGYDAYDDVLKDISFKARPGETIAILGSTGSGKTSLVQLLQRLYTCTAGEITIDGVNINDIDHRVLRSNIGIVLQEPFLYSRTIKENIAIVRPDATDGEIHEAAKIAAVHDVVESFENKYDTVVGERGVTLSGGQKQRVAIARMLMQNAPILIFDDSMSAVDTETDAAIREALNKRRRSSTTFIISHRITTLCEADNILVLDDGRLVQQGTHDELLGTEGLYSRVAGIQNMLENELKEGGVER